ncbi:MAG: hypothetical protein A2096_03860 [Spirochaetes bacterium GWF1_41_5]|nr:MAG: hypothetical protein A2096_03860 [Spirochaetes bacterium GWF1_41_5]HBE00910.1 hypothetical protein [Spirochaetia bacterium]
MLKNMRYKPCVMGNVCIPYTKKNGFIDDLFRQTIQELISYNIKNLYIFGTAGEGYAVSNAMFTRIARSFFDETKSISNNCLLGVIGMSVEQIKEKIDIGIDIGFKMFQISLPPWGKCNDKEMFNFFDEILGAYPNCNFLHYNTIRGLRTLTGKEYGIISSTYKNLVASKISSNNLFGILSVFYNAPQMCHFFTEFEYAYAGLFSPCGLILTSSSINLKLAADFFNSVKQKNLKKIVNYAEDFYTILFSLFENTASGQHIDGAYDKIYAKILNKDFPLELISPYQYTTDAEFENFKETLKRNLPKWMKSSNGR